METDEVMLTEQQKADLEKTTNECQEKLKEVKRFIQETLWVSFGSSEMSIALQAAEAASERVAAVQPNINQDAYEIMLDQLKGLAVTAKDTYGRWKQWAPPMTQKELQSHVRRLELQVPLMVSRKADFIQATIKEELKDKSRWELHLIIAYQPSS